MKRRFLWIIPISLLLGLLLFLKCSAKTSPSKQTPSSTVSQAPNPFAVVSSPMPAPLAPLSSSERDAQTGQVRVKSRWGSSRGTLGKSSPSEGNPEAPMSFALTKEGSLVALDQVNTRLVWFDKEGKFERDAPLGQRAAQDIATTSDGKLVVLDRLGDRNVEVLDRNGKTLGKLPLEGTGIPKGGGVTGVFVDGKNIYAEYEHGRTVLLGTTDGVPASEPRGDLPGRPSRDGRLILSAGIVQAREGRMWVSAMDRPDMTHRFTRELRMPLPILRIVLLDSDLRGTIYAAAHLGDEGLDQAVGVQLVCLDPDRGVPTGRAFISVPDEPEEMFRTMSALDEGGVIVAVPTETGLEYRTYFCE